MFKTNIIIWACLVLLGLVLVSRNPEYIEEEKIRLRYGKLQRDGDRFDIITFKQGITSVKFYHMFAMKFCGCFFGLYIASVFKAVN